MTYKLPQMLLRPATLRALAVLLAASVVVVLTATLPGLHHNLEDSSGDPLWRLASQGAASTESRVVVVDIDEGSLARYGAWPWSRERVAALSEALHRQGARVQLMDIVFPEARDGDKSLAQAQSQYALHVGQIFDLSPDGNRVGVLSGVLDGTPCQGHFPVAGGYVANTAELARSAGHITPVFDADGSVRRIAPVLCHQQRAYPALALLGLESLSRQPLHVRYEAGRDLFGPYGWLAIPGLGMRVPLDGDGTTRLAYRLPRNALTAISAADVLEGKVPAGMLDGVIALVGATAFGIGDTVTTPLNATVPGVEVHAQFIAGLLDDTLPYTPRAALGLQFGFALVALLVLLQLSVRKRAQHAYVVPLTGAGLALLAYAGHAALLLQAGLWVGWLAPALFALLVGLTLASAEFAITRIERERVYRNLCSYLPEQVAADIALREPVGSIEAERREVTVLFADLRNFSAFCEARSPEEAAGLLHAFFGIANRVVQAHGGIVEEFVGDAIMAIWNAPRPCAGHPERAMQAAIQLVEEVCRILPDAPPGLEPLALGIGLETGNALVGSFGPVERRTHTALGETVTVASRLQSMTADLASPIVIGPGAAAHLPNAGLVSVGNFLLEGLQRPRTLYLPAPGSIPEAEVEQVGASRIRLVV